MTNQYQRQPQHGGSEQYSGQMAESSTGMGGQQMGGQQMHGERTGAGTPTHGMQGQQPGTQQGGTQTVRSYEDHLTDELRLLLEDFSELSHVTAWCAKECATGAPELGICARICQDLAEIAELNEMLIARDSMFGPEVADMFIRVASEGLSELQRHQQQHPHITETIATIERTMNSAETVLQQVGGQQTASQGMTDQMGGQQMSQPMGGQQMSGQSMGGQQMGQPMGGQQMSGQPTSGRGMPEMSGRGMRGMPEQGAHGQGMSGQPTGGTEPTERQY